MGKGKSDLELFDISDIEVDFVKTKSLTEVLLRVRSQEPINLMRFYLFLSDYVARMADEIGVIEGCETKH